MESPPRLPPMFVIDAAKSVHRAMSSAQRLMSPPSASLMEMMSSMWRPRALGVVAELGIADLLAGGPMDVAELASQAGCHEGALYRIMRALAHDGIFAQPSPRRFALTRVSEPLQSDHPGTVRNIIRWSTSKVNLRTWTRLQDAVTSGEPQSEAELGKELWAYFAEDDPELGQVFHGAMADLTRMTAPLLAALYDFGRHRTLVDVGGGRAMLLSRLLRMFPELRGIDYDLAEAVKEAPRVLREAGVEGRCEVIEGSFMEGIPAGHDAYLMKHIVHGFDDAALDKLFENLRAALEPGSTLLLVEFLVPESNSGVHPSFLDFQMLVGSGGRERTATEYDELFDAHGFRLKEVLRTPSPSALLVGERR